MEVTCDRCATKTTLDDWWAICSCGYILLRPIPAGKKYCKRDTRYMEVSLTRKMIEREGNFYLIDNKVIEIRCGQQVYGTIRVEGVFKERLEKLVDIKKEMKSVEDDLEEMEKSRDDLEEKLARKDRDLERIQAELQEAKADIGVKDEALVEKETNEALGKVKDYEADIGRRAVEKEALQVEAQKKVQAAQEKAKKLKEELRKFQQKDNEKATEREEAAKKIQGLQNALSTANDKLEDSVVVNDFRRQEFIKNEQIMAEKETSFNDYKRKMEKEMDDMKKHYEQQKDSLQKKVDDMGRDFDDQKISLVAINAGLKRQNEILFKAIDKLTESAGSSNAKDSRVNGSTVEKEEKEGRVVVDGCEQMKEEEEV